MISPSVAEERRRLRARSLRRKPSRTMDWVTRLAVSGPTPGSPFTTRETVFRLTPAACATSFIVGLLDEPAGPALRWKPAPSAVAVTAAPSGVSTLPASRPHLTTLSCPSDGVVKRDPTPTAAVWVDNDV